MPFAQTVVQGAMFVLTIKSLSRFGTGEQAMTKTDGELLMLLPFLLAFIIPAGCIVRLLLAKKMKHNGIKHLKNLAGRLREKSAFGRNEKVRENALKRYYEVKAELDKRLAYDKSKNA